MARTAELHDVNEYGVMAEFATEARQMARFVEGHRVIINMSRVAGQAMTESEAVALDSRSASVAGANVSNFLKQRKDKKGDWKDVPDDELPAKITDYVNAAVAEGKGITGDSLLYEACDRVIDGLYKANGKATTAVQREAKVAELMHGGPAHLAAHGDKIRAAIEAIKNEKRGATVSTTKEVPELSLV